MVREILRNHPKLEARDSEGKTAMFAAGNYRSSDKSDARVECVQLLVKAGAKVNARDNDGNMPLHEIFLTDMEEDLLKLGADLTIHNNKGETVLEAAKERGPDREKAHHNAIEKSKLPPQPLTPQHGSIQSWAAFYSLPAIYRSPSASRVIEHPSSKSSELGRSFVCPSGSGNCRPVIQGSFQPVIGSRARRFSAPAFGCVAVPVAGFIRLEMRNMIEAISGRGPFAALRPYAGVSVIRMKAVIHAATEVIMAMKPRTRADENAAGVPFRPIVTVGGAVIRSSVIVTIRAIGRGSNLHSHLRRRLGRGQHHETSRKKRYRGQLESNHSLS
jgi:hypothetical protein